MGLADQIMNDMKAAMKNRDSARLSTIRMLKSTMKNKEIELKRALSDTEVIAVVRSMIKQREDSIIMFKKGERDDLADKEGLEIKILAAYLPERLLIL